MEELISRICRRANVKSKYARTLIDNIQPYYVKVFTDSSYDPRDNYEIFEFLGDVTINKFVAWYLFFRYPQFDCPQGVKVLTRMKINAISKTTFSQIADSLGFWPLIRASETRKNSAKSKKSMLEDVFEAFFGATELILDTTYIRGLGSAVCYTILQSLFDEVDFSLKYEDLYDAVTRLKELGDSNPSLLPIEYVQKTNPNVPNEKMTIVFVHREQLGEAEGPLVDERKKIAAAKAMEILTARGYKTRAKAKAEALVCQPPL